jgi:hypothetical protein
LVSVLHRFLAIPVLCASGLQAWQCYGESSASGWPQPAQQMLPLCIRCEISNTSASSVHRQVVNIWKILNIPVWSNRKSLVHSSILILNFNTHYLLHTSSILT